MPSVCASWGICQTSSELRKWPKPTVRSGLLRHHATAWNQRYQNCEEKIKTWIHLMANMLIVWWRNLWHVEPTKCKRKMSSFRRSGPGSSTWKSKSSERTVLVSQCVLLQWGSLVFVEENPEIHHQYYHWFVYCFIGAFFKIYYLPRHLKLLHRKGAVV